jgi:predicted AAA+ superfamily ATPase
LSAFVGLKTDKSLDFFVFVCYNVYRIKKGGILMILRKAYLDQIIPLVDKKIIKVLTGVRRSGKTVLLSQIQNYLLDKGVAEENVVNISLESKKNNKYKDGDLLYEHLLSTCEAVDGRTYIFLDEIQAVNKWEEVVSSLLVDVDCDIYITGSNSKLLSGELATLIAGRYIQIRVYPFTLSEAKAIQKQNGKYISDESLFADYLRYGGLPMRFSLEDVSLEPYLSDTYDAIVVKDVVQRNNVKDTALLNMILTFLMDNVANPFSARSIVAALKAEGISTTVETVISYINYIKNAMVLYSAQRYDIKGKKLLTTNEKYYAVDLGLRNCVKSSGEIDYNKLYENIVYLELLYRGYDVKVGKTDDYEIDFIAYRGSNILYVQVCYLLASSETVEREFGNLERIKDNYPKYVVSGDIPDFSRNGIKHYNIIKFLLNE